MYARPTAPLSIGGVVDDAIKLYRASFRRCVPVALLGSLVMAAFGIFVIEYARHAGLALTGLESLQIYAEPPVMAAALLQSVLSLALTGAVIVILNAVAAGDARLRFGQAIGIGFSRLARCVIAAVLGSLLVLAGCIALVVPGIYLLGTLFLWPVALYVENAGAIESLRVSHKLIRGRWWSSSTILTAPLLIMFAFLLGADLVAEMFALLLRLDAAATQILFELVNVLANIFVLPMLPAALIALYQDLKMRREGGELAARIRVT